MNDVLGLDTALTRHSIERELGLVAGAIQMVAGGGAPAITLVGLSFGPEVLAGSALAATAARGATRRVLATGLRPALLILDINLPVDSGWSLLRDGSLAAAGSPPVVIMSGTQIRPERLRECGVAGYLPKPVSMALLTSCVTRIIRTPNGSGLTDSTEE